MSQESILVGSLVRGPLIGTLVSLVLYGVTCLQAFFYFQTYVHDRVFLKLTAAMLLILETTHAALSISIMDYYLVTKYGQMQVLESATWACSAMYIIGFLIDFLVYLYFTWRIWAFTRNLWIVIFMVLIAVSRTSLSVIPCFWSVLSGTWLSYLRQAKPMILAGNIIFILGDIVSASIMAHYLKKHRIGLYRTNLLIDRLLVFVVATGAIVVFFDSLALILTLVQSDSLAFMGVILIQTRLYANSLFTSLNIRNANSSQYLAHQQHPTNRDPVTSLRFAELSTSQGGITDPPRSGVESWYTAPMSPV